MDFYESIAKYYEYIFPFKKDAFNFIMRNVTSENTSLLDIGCATGQLSLAIAKEGIQVTAIDLDREMILKAKEQDEKHLVDYKTLNMLDINKCFPQKNFDLISCFGNTVVHLNYVNDIKDLFQSMYNLLKDNGKILIQILNYQYIIEQSIAQLPLIENEKIKFERYYVEQVRDERIIFSTKLTIKETGEVIDNEIYLYPIYKNRIQEMLEKIGYRNIQFYSNFKAKPYEYEWIPLVFEAQR